ncbi:Uncharacterized protein PBTT_04689 [Plasmodiophora brassicae]|uniref:Uncharacterized protein n=1 Tax=Plasmodiophora brassicae TaxID=37360 RepID=A0A0G4IRW1_PLABS|nr:hypothetical protein PBRA_006051 [Plasmodiophora brassicae]SPQ98152.1 unnamed protein product [Plasmodiophora brassicae]
MPAGRRRALVALAVLVVLACCDVVVPCADADVDELAALLGALDLSKTRSAPTPPPGRQATRPGASEVRRAGRRAAAHRAYRPRTTVRFDPIAGATDDDVGLHRCNATRWWWLPTANALLPVGAGAAVVGGGHLLLLTARRQRQRRVIEQDHRLRRRIAATTTTTLRIGGGLAAAGLTAALLLRRPRPAPLVVPPDGGRRRTKLAAFHDTLRDNVVAVVVTGALVALAIAAVMVVRFRRWRGFVRDHTNAVAAWT